MAISATVARSGNVGKSTGEPAFVGDQAGDGISAVLVAGAGRCDWGMDAGLYCL